MLAPPTQVPSSRVDASLFLAVYGSTLAQQGSAGIPQRFVPVIEFLSRLRVRNGEQAERKNSQVR